MSLCTTKLSLYLAKGDIQLAPSPTNIMHITLPSPPTKTPTTGSSRMALYGSQNKQNKTNTKHIILSVPDLAFLHFYPRCSHPSYPPTKLILLQRYVDITITETYMLREQGKSMHAYPNASVLDLVRNTHPLDHGRRCTPTADGNIMSYGIGSSLSIFTYRLNRGMHGSTHSGSVNHHQGRRKKAMDW